MLDSPIPRGETVIVGPHVTLYYFKNEEEIDESYKVIEHWSLTYLKLIIII